jgi:8-oxo-dGTP pyrophosphatase MutT (NUDIX family)
MAEPVSGRGRHFEQGTPNRPDEPDAQHAQDAQEAQDAPGADAAPEPEPDADVVRAAGGAVWRWGASDIEVLLVHRPRYDDWTLPKGKLLPYEDDADAALREVEEETGLECELGAELATTRYVDSKGRPKVVRYWAMEVYGQASKPFQPNDEVDKVLWLQVEKAVGQLSYDRDRDVLEALMDATDT